VLSRNVSPLSPVKEEEEEGESSKFEIEMVGKKKKEMSLEEINERKRILKDWINQHSKGEEGFTALHFAAFHGNMRIIKLLMSYGSNVYAKNKQEINMLHVAS
jgi:hypothetical protein